MAIYAKKLTPEWKKSFEEYERLTGFEPISQESIDSGESTPKEVWEENIRWLEMLVGDASNISIPWEDEPTNEPATL